MITHINLGFNFLGFNVRKYHNKGLTKPKKGSVKSISHSIKECVNYHKAVSQKELIRMISTNIKGWANLFRHAAAKQIFSRLDNKVFKLLWKWAKRIHPNKGSCWIRAKYFKTSGNRQWVLLTNDGETAYELPFFDATKIRRHIKIKSPANHYGKEWHEYFIERELYWFGNLKTSAN